MLPLAIHALLVPSTRISACKPSPPSQSAYGSSSGSLFSTKNNVLRTPLAWGSKRISRSAESPGFTTALDGAVINSKSPESPPCADTELISSGPSPMLESVKTCAATPVPTCTPPNQAPFPASMFESPFTITSPLVPTIFRSGTGRLCVPIRVATNRTRRSIFTAGPDSDVFRSKVLLLTTERPNHPPAAVFPMLPATRRLR